MKWIRIAGEFLKISAGTGAALAGLASYVRDRTAGMDGIGKEAWVLQWICGGYPRLQMIFLHPYHWYVELVTQVSFFQIIAWVMTASIELDCEKGFVVLRYENVEVTLKA